MPDPVTPEKAIRVLEKRQWLRMSEQTLISVAVAADHILQRMRASDITALDVPGFGLLTVKPIRVLGERTWSVGWEDGGSLNLGEIGPPRDQLVYGKDLVLTITEVVRFALSISLTLAILKDAEARR